MKQILQDLKVGSTELAEVPAPKERNGHLLIQTSRSLISAGTERMLVDFGKAGLVNKARQQPDKVRMVIDKVKTDGLMPTIETVRNKLDQPLPLGYCNVGQVIKVGSGVTEFSSGDRIASNGKHAEIVCVPRNLCAKIPDNVSDDEAAFTVIGAIGLQGIRLVEPTLGESIVVIGLGLIGLVTVQLLKAQGCRVLGIDFDESKLALARQFGAETVNGAKADVVQAALDFSQGRGVDAVLITASTKSSEPVHQAATMSRKKGRIVLVGVTGLELSRADFFEKELSFQVSCSYGPGRYDLEYEDKGHDYPLGYVRWTEQRNFEAVLNLMSEGRLDMKPLISHRFEIGIAQQAYDLIASHDPSLGIMLDYQERDTQSDKAMLRRTVPVSAEGIKAGSKVVTSFIGSGNYATSVLIPAFKASGAFLKNVASNAGVSGLHAGRKHGFVETTTDADSIFEDDDTDIVVITTRHDSHADYVLKAIAAEKHVFVEKPLCLTLEELETIQRAYQAKEKSGTAPLLMVGFNRRFAPHIQKLKTLLDNVSESKSFILTVNAGAIPANHWTQDKDVGGGRIVGEACHFIDLLRYLTGSPIQSYTRSVMGSATQDTLSLQLTFEDGSIGTIHYFANGPKSFPKERLEVFAAGHVLQMDNFRKMLGYGWPGFKKMNLSSQNKGQAACAKAFVTAVKNGSIAPISADEIFEVSRISIEMA